MTRFDYGRDIPIRIEILSQTNQKLTRYFFCGNGTIDAYFQREAAHDPTVVTYLVIDEANEKPVACLSVACSAIFLSERKQFSTLLSAMEVVYFAVDVDYQGLPYRPGDDRSLSHYIFSYMLELLRDISHRTIGAAKVVLYSVPEARTFYERLEFVPFETTMFGDKGTFVTDCVPMYFDLN